MAKISGTIKKVDVGVGTWALSAEDGRTYELRNLPAEMKQVGLQVVIQGEILKDAMSIAMIGDILSITTIAAL